MLKKYSSISKISGLKFNELGVMKVDKTWDDVGIKIVDALEDGDNRIKRAIKEGRKVLLLPGVYDILHAGHISWIYEAYNAFKQRISKENKYKYKREDIYVVVPMDNDCLARAEKIYLHESYGGHEKFMRPIVYQERRALSLANIDIVDLVIPMVSPLEIDEIVSQPKRISVDYAYKLLNRLNLLGNFTKNEYDELLSSLNIYKEIIKPNLALIKKDFARLNFPKEVGETLFPKIEDSVLWNNPSWQLYIYQILFKEKNKIPPKMKNLPNRIISQRDGCSEQTRFLMSLCGISINSILDTYITSTTKIIAKAEENKYDLLEIIS
ncbi:hypothetical protein M0R04_00250 [Candidatus Dojkabacteria bacterium]|jgi:glycerol-3-phosphate cytidylyltransferase-like family protein|nr:hypothetical protein [Candidatus Dojkabacteria bacterium]